MEQEMSEMQLVITRNMLRYQVGRQITCPQCRHILDVRSAVSVDVYQGEELKGTSALCAKCWEDPIKARLDRMWAKVPGYRIEVTDGRVLFARHAAATNASGSTSVIKAADVHPGMRFEMRHSSGFITARVVAIKQHDIRSRFYPYNPTGMKRQFVCVNERTGREIVVKSAAKFRRVVA